LGSDRLQTQSKHQNDDIEIENRILRAKIEDMQSKMSSLQTNFTNPMPHKNFE
jgi:hypothetical protein